MASKVALDPFTQLTNEFRGETLNRIASVVGESPAKTEIAIDSLITAFFSSLARKASTTAGANEVLDIIRRNNLTSVNLTEITRTEGIADLANTGRSFMDFTLGDKVTAAIDRIASHTGISRSSAVSLGSMCAPIVLGMIGRRFGSSGFKASGLSALLGSPGRFLQNAPAELVSALGLNGAADAAHRVASDTERPGTTGYPYVEHAKRSPWGWLLPLLLAVATIGLFAYLISRRQPTPNPKPAARTEAPAPAPVALVPAAPATSSADLGAFIDVKLPNTVNLHIPSNGVENKLLAFISDPSETMDKETWFSFDRLEFETDSAKLKPSSQVQLTNIAEILKAYPQVAVKIGGYTDNTGDPTRNRILSQARATSTLSGIVALGISKSRLVAEGYGQEHPVADNSTPEGRQRNRRIDIRVTEK
jgi:OOP family OmpA-OmpF porin